MYPCTLKNLTPEDQIEIKKNPKIRDFETYQQKKQNKTKFEAQRCKNHPKTRLQDPLKTLPRFLD